MRGEEYSRLEENGDLVRLKVQGGNAVNGVGSYVNEEAVRLALREHRPELAQLAFAEFASQLEVDDCNANASNDCVPVLLDPPSEDGSYESVLVCGTCCTVYYLLEQARDLLNSYDEMQEQEDQELLSTVNDACDKNDPREMNHNQAAINQVTELTCNSLKKSKTEGPNSSQCGKYQAKPLASSASFHGPINPLLSDTKSPSFVGKKRDRKQMEENSKIHVLIAESDEVRVLQQIYQSHCDCSTKLSFMLLQTTTKLAKRLLEKQGYKVDVATNETDCVKLLEKRSYSILLINESLSGRDASTIGKWIRKQEELEQVTVKMRILVMVQRILAINYHDYDEMDVDGFIPKPLEGSKLLPSVQKAASQYTESLHLDGVAKAAAAEKAKKVALEMQQVSSENADASKRQTPETLDAPKRRGKRDKKTKSARKSGQQKSLKRDRLKREDPITVESTFQYDENTYFPYAILCNGSDSDLANDTSNDTGQEQRAPWCNLIVCQDVFDTYERFKIFFLPMVARYTGMRILLWNYPGQAFTTFSDDVNLNNKYHADCLFKLLEHTNGSGKGKFNLDRPFFIMAHGSGAAIATYFASVYHTTSLRGLLLFNGLSHVDSHYASVFHDCRNVFSCSPESRPDLPVYFYARFLFSPAYLSKTSSSLALNVYTAVHNPITLNGRKRLCQGVLNHVDTRPLLKDIPSPIISVHGENATLVRVMHAAEFLSGRCNCPTIPQALRGGNRSAVVMMKGGHELFQEKKDQISLLIEQILTGYHDKIHEPQYIDDSNPAMEKEPKKNEADRQTTDVYNPKKKSFEDKFIDGVLKKTRGGRSSWDVYQEEIMMEQQSNSQNKSPPQSNIIKKDQQQSNGLKENKQFDPNDYPEVKEYMAWRIRRHKKRLAALDRSARVIQCAMRCFMAKTMVKRVRKEKAIMFIQRCMRGSHGRKVYRFKKKELWAARFVQRTLRGHRGRCVSYSMRMEKNAQIIVARMLRGLVARRRFHAVLAKRENAATNIQSMWRMYAAILLKRYHRRRRDAATFIQKVYRGHRGRRKAALERDKYIFSRSQNSGIEIGRQLLAEHKLHATKIQSELSLLHQEKDKMEKQIEFHLTEVSNFDRTISELEKKMHQISKFERETFGVLASPKQVELQEEKRRMDEEFSETLNKIADRKIKLEQLESTFEQLMRTRQEKFGQLKSLEGKLAVLLDAQDSALENIRRKKEEKIDSILPPRPSQTEVVLQKHTQHHAATPGHLPLDNNTANNYYYSGPSEKDKMQAAKLIGSTEQMMKFGFMSMSLTYFSSLNMMKAMQRVAVNDAMGHHPTSVEQSQYSQQTPTAMIHNQSMDKAAAVKVESWSVNDVSKWLASISLSQYQPSFKEGAVDGSFLCELTDDDLRNTLGVEHRLHRKKILFSIHCLKSYAEAHSSYSTPSPMQTMQPQHYGTNGTKSIASMSSNMALYESVAYDPTKFEGIPHESPYSTHSRHYESIAASPNKSGSVLDILTPSKTEKVRKNSRLVLLGELYPINIILLPPMHSAMSLFVT